MARLRRSSLRCPRLVFGHHSEAGVLDAPPREPHRRLSRDTVSAERRDSGVSFLIEVRATPKDLSSMLNETGFRAVEKEVRNRDPIRL